MIAAALTPLLLADRTADTMEWQVFDEMCDHGTTGGRLVCWVEVVGIDHPIPDYWRTKERIGCVMADSSRDADFVAGRDDDFRSFVLFEPWAFHRAWRIARQLVATHAGLAARVASADLVGIFVVLAPAHRFSLDGQEVRP